MSEETPRDLLESVLSADLKQCLIALSDTEEFNKRLRHTVEMLEESSLPRKILEYTLLDPEFQALYDLAYKHTAIDKLWNRHDIFHAVTCVGYGVTMSKILATTKYWTQLDKYFLPTVVMALLWHDIQRSFSRQHSVGVGWMARHLQETLQICSHENLIDIRDCMKLVGRSLSCITEHNSEERCSGLDAAVVRIAEGIDCDEYRSYLSKLYRWGRLLEGDQLTHVLGTLLIKKLSITSNSNPSRPVLIVAALNGQIEHWYKYNWFQVQDRIKRKIESSGYGYLFRLEARFENGSFFYDFK